MARGAEGAPACDMSKHFDSNYHHIVPELDEQSGGCWLGVYSAGRGGGVVWCGVV